MVVQVFNPSTQQAEVGRSLGVQSQSALQSQQELHGVRVSKKNYNKIKRDLGSVTQTHDNIFH